SHTPSRVLLSNYHTIQHEEDVDNALKFWIWATDALVVPCLFKVYKETLRRRKMLGTWRVSVKFADSVGAEEIVDDEWTSIKRRFPDYDDGFMYDRDTISTRAPSEHGSSLLGSSNGLVIFAFTNPFVILIWFSVQEIVATSGETVEETQNIA
ncbi:hypothetical protein Tco_0053440, partial [Tanacetum coccineum]